MAEEALLPSQSTVAAVTLPRTVPFWSAVNQGLDFCYQSLKRRWLLLLTAAMMLSLLAGALWLPQLPGQLRNDPAASVRWLLGTSSSYGALGGLLRMLGIFDALHSPLLQLTLAALVLILLVYLCDCLVMAWRFYRLPALLTARTEAIGAPVERALPLLTFRQRQAVRIPPPVLHEQLQQVLRAKFTHLQENQVAVATGGAEENETEDGQEWRLLAIHNRLGLYLRPLGLLGILLALAALWSVVIAGWSITPPLLAPGDTFRYGPKNLEIHYVAPISSTVPQVSATIDGITVQQEIAQVTRLRLGSVELLVRPGPPALWVRVSRGKADLERAGQFKVASQLGLVFPSIRNEESIMLRKQGVGLGIVRTAEGATTNDLTGFQVELYRETEPPEEITMQPQERQVIPIDKQVALEFTLLPSLTVTTSYQPGQWLLWLAPLLCLVGGAGFLRRPVYLLVQVGPWPDLRSVVVLQSNVMAEIEQLQALLHPAE